MELIKKLLEQLSKKDKRIIARTISLVEINNSNSVELLKNIYKNTGNAYRVGITGPPGAGKSTLTNQLTKHLRAEGFTVGIIAVDPTSPFTGGALLGDRVRMSEIGMDEGVFIRSMATRGSLGGLSKKASDAADVLDAAGYNFVILETVGVGQSELDIVEATDSTIVVLVPESGDSIQAMKAGLMEIADFFVLNKSDRQGSDQAVTALKTILMIKEHDEKSWLPNIIRAVATENKGTKEISDEINRHKEYLISTGKFTERRKHRSKVRIKEIVENQLKEELWKEDRLSILNDSLEKVAVGTISPYTIAEEIVKIFKKTI